MKLLGFLLLLVLIAVGLTVGLPLLAAAAGLAIGLGCLFIWLLPFLIIATSDKTTGGEKIAWLLAMIFLSWFAWIFYWLLAPLKQKELGYSSRHRDRYDYDRYRRYRSHDYREHGYR